VTTLTYEVKCLQRRALSPSTLFLDIKGGFDNVKAEVLCPSLSQKNVPHYLVAWIGFFLTKRTCSLKFQVSPCTIDPVSVGTAQGSQVSPLLFISYVAPLHQAIPRGLSLSYVDDFPITAASPSFSDKIKILSETFTSITTAALPLGVPFSIPKTQLIH